MAYQVLTRSNSNLTHNQGSKRLTPAAIQILKNIWAHKFTTPPRLSLAVLLAPTPPLSRRPRSLRPSRPTRTGSSPPPRPARASLALPVSPADAAAPASPSALASVSPADAAATPSRPSPPRGAAGLRQLGAANSRASSVASSTPPTRGPHPVGPPSSRRAPTRLYPLLGHLGAAEPRDSSAASSTPRLNENGAITPLRSGVTAPNCGVPDVPPRRVGEFLLLFVLESSNNRLTSQR